MECLLRFQIVLTQFDAKLIAFNFSLFFSFGAKIKDLQRGKPVK